jgi:hypothetical protein
MSWQATTAVIRHSKAKGSDRLLLLCIANYAGEDGSGSFPSNYTLCCDSKLTERAVRYILRRLEASGELKTELGRGPNGSNRYSINLPFAAGNVRPKKKKSAAFPLGQSLPGQEKAKHGANGAHGEGHGVAPKQSLAVEQSVNGHKNPSASGDAAGTVPPAGGASRNDHLSQPGPQVWLTDSDVSRIYRKYPRKLGPDEAKKAIWKAIARVMKGDAEHKPMSRDEAIVLIESATEEFAKSHKGNQGKTTPYPATFYNAGRYWDDPREWENEYSAEELRDLRARSEASIGSWRPS